MFSFYFFFFKQKTAYEMRISDWSSDVCSSDLGVAMGASSGMPGSGQSIPRSGSGSNGDSGSSACVGSGAGCARAAGATASKIGRASCRERVFSVRVDLGGRRIIKKKNKPRHTIYTQHKYQPTYTPPNTN